MRDLLHEIGGKLEKRLDAIEAGITALLSTNLATETAKHVLDEVTPYQSDCNVVDMERDAMMNDIQVSEVDTSAEYDLRELWAKFGQTTTGRSFSSIRTSEKDTEYQSRSLKKTHWFIIRPSSGLRLGWDTMGLAMIALEVLTTPVQLAFDVDQSGWFPHIFWASLIFWTLEIPISFISGYYHRGSEELRLHKIVFQYMRTWMILDVLIVGVDWSSVLLTRFDDPGISMTRTGKVLRILRVFRSLRLLRLVKLRRLLESTQDLIQSEHIHIGMSVLKYVVAILCASHVVACAWYGISSSAQGPTWISEMNLTDAEFSYRYFTALHWSLTQFTPASVNIVPHNLVERVYAVIVLLFALIVFSSLISSITSAMSQLKQLSTFFDKDLSVLRRYLRRHNVPVELTIRILRYAEHKVHLQKQEIQEKGVNLIKVLSRPLHMELLRTTLGHILTNDPFFRCYSDTDTEAMKRVCFEATSSVHLSAGDILFSEATHDDRIMFVQSGELVYTNMTGNAKFRRSEATHTLDAANDTCILQPSSWCCEAALWTDWVHVGMMRATLDSEVLVIDAPTFAQASSKHYKVMDGIIKYAEGFVHKLNELADRNIFSDFIPSAVQNTFLEELASESFCCETFQTKRRHLLERFSTRLVGRKSCAKASSLPQIQMVGAESELDEISPAVPRDGSEDTLCI